MSVTQGLSDYFEVRRQERAARVARKWAALNKRQRLLVREAAVMGYVEGRQDEKTNIKFRGDTEIVNLVLAATDDFADLYPYLAALPRQRRLPSNAPGVTA